MPAVHERQSGTTKDTSWRRPRYRLVAAGVRAGLLGLLVAGVAAQQRELVLQNLAPYPRREIAAVVVPFASGEVVGLPALHVRERPTVWQPFGARWPDGSLRQALCLFESEIGQLAEIREVLLEGAGPALPTGEIAMPKAAITFIARIGSERHRAVAQRVRDLENNALRRVELRRARIGGSGLVAELIVTACRDQPHAYVDAAVFFSDPTTKAMQLEVEELAVRAQGHALVFRHGTRLGVWQQLTDDGSRAILLSGRAIGDGQGLRRSAVLVPPLAGGESLIDASSRAACIAPLLGATTWRDVDAFGAFGHVPEPPSWLRDNRLLAHLAERHRVFADGDRRRGDPFGRGPLIQARRASQTGDQQDFGVVKLSLVAHSGLPSMLHEAEASVLQEACRPVHFFAVDGAPIDPAQHPEWIVWSGRTHWHAGVSPDRLGKPHPPPPFQSHGWTGKDRQHWSSNHLGAFALLSGAHWARRELQHEIQLYLSGQTLDPAKSTSGAGAPRGAGRTLLAATWMYLATGDERLLRRMNERLDRVHWPQWQGRDGEPEAVRPFVVSKPDPRMLRGAATYWTPWQEAIAAVGFGAAFKVTGNENARRLAEGLAMNCTRHGWLLTDATCTVALALRWQDGRPLTAAELSDPEAAQWSHAFNPWAIGAVEIARVAALAADDHALAERAERILQHVRSNRRPPSHNPPELGGLDRLTEWDAIVW